MTSQAYSLPGVIDLSDDESDDQTIIGDEEFERLFVRPTPEVDLCYEDDVIDPLLVDLIDVLTWSASGRTYREGKTAGLLDGDFLRIKSVHLHRSRGSVFIRGYRFRRTRCFHGFFGKGDKPNEVVLLLDETTKHPNQTYERSLCTVEITQVLGLRYLVKTNKKYDDLNYFTGDHGARSWKEAEVESRCRLVCRWKVVAPTKISRGGQTSSSWVEGTFEALGKGGAIEALRYIEADDSERISDDMLKESFRGQTELGGACKSWTPEEEEWDRNELWSCHGVDVLDFHQPPRYSTATFANPIDLTGTDVESPTSRIEKRYTFGDAFCGAGGTSRVAKGAGLKVAWGFDHNPVAIDSYQRNFCKTSCWEIDAHNFVTVDLGDHKADVVHLSPPCQTFSPAHTIPSPMDERNEATFLALGDILRKVTPRIATVEETSGLIERHAPWFSKLVDGFTSIGFSIRWKIHDFATYGLPQSRRRVFMNASCPGEVLPNFPKITHCKAADLHLFPSLKHFATINDAIAHIPHGFSHHNPDQAPRRTASRSDANLPLKGCITTSGGASDVHPSGTRAYTNRELACLQSFPLEHVFGIRETKKQIGNAMPPVIAKVFYEEIISALRKADGL